MVFPELAERLARVRATIAERQQDAGIEHDVRIVAVTKTHGPEAVAAAVAAGLPDVGENRVQEALPKQAATGPGARWHLIGSLQRNKVRQALGRFVLIHSIDRLELAKEFHERLEPGTRQGVLVQVNCSQEPQKGGIAPDDLPALLEAMRPFGNLNVLGLMTMAAFGAAEPEQRRTFARLRQLRDASAAAGRELRELSMGMSDDFPAAVSEGATMLRLGTALFGRRE